MRAHTLDTVIVGAGPVGLALSIELGRAGLRCLVLEQRDRETPHPRAKLTNVRSMTLMRRWGIADDVRAAAPLPPSFPSDVAFVTRLTGWELARIPDALSTARDRDRPFPEPAQQIPQGNLEAVLRATAEALPQVEIRTGVRVESFTQDQDGVEVQARELTSGQSLSFDAAYLAGCDGARSQVRETLEIGMEGDPLLGENVGAVIAAPGLRSLNDKDLAVHYWLFNRDSPGILGPLDGADTWWLHLNETPVGERLTDAALRERFFDAVGQELPCEILANVPWTAQRLIATSYRSGRTFLLGDAAHLHPPMGGYGMNMGIGDAVDLGWKLAAVLLGWGGEALLESYEQERRPIHLRVLEEASSNYSSNASRLLDPDLERPDQAGEDSRRRFGESVLAAKKREFASLGVQLGYRYESSPLISRDGTAEPPDPVETYSPTARPGHLAPHVWIDEDRCLYDLMSTVGMTMLVFGGARKSEEIRARVGASKVPIKVVPIDRPDVLDIYGADLVLVRPDQQVAWRGSEPEAGLEAARIAAGLTGTVT